MYSEVKTCILHGLEGYVINVETDISNGMPNFNIVGLPDTSIKEAKERVRSSIKNIGGEFPLKRITINLVPANIKKDGSQLDLAIAVGILSAAGFIKENSINKSMAFIGELSLDGKINKVDGVLPMIICLRKHGVKTCIVPYDSKDEASILPDMEIIPVKSLAQALDYLNGNQVIEAYKQDKIDRKVNYKYEVDFSDIKGQENLKRALEVAAAGGHNILIIGPPGSGKTMAAKTLVTILPELTFEESIEVTNIYSISGLLTETGLIKKRPFRSPHHTSSAISIVGGGRDPKPGEISLSHNGVLFLDELPEFHKKTIEVLRQPMEDRIVTIARANGRFTYPCNFMLVAAMNPCPCGYYGDTMNECNCSQNSINRYLEKISGPLLDRIDIHVEVKAVKYEELKDNKKLETSDSIRKRVSKAKKLQVQRYKSINIYNNAQLSPKDIKKYCILTSSAEKIMDMAFRKYKFSARSYHKVLKIARSIADLDCSHEIEEIHILEAIRYRTIADKYWK